MYTDKILNTAYSFAAAIVVFGAWAKLEQKEFGGLALTIGMLVESGIFLIYGLMEWRKEKQAASREQQVSETHRIDELQQTVEKTNGMLKKIFRTGEL